MEQRGGASSSACGAGIEALTQAGGLDKDNLQLVCNGFRIWMEAAENHLKPSSLIAYKRAVEKLVRIHGRSFEAMAGSDYLMIVRGSDVNGKANGVYQTALKKFKCFYEARVQQCGGAFEVDPAWQNNSSNSKPEDSTQVCLACAKGDFEDLLLMCDGECGRLCHTHCCDPPLDAVPDDDWFCPACSTEHAKPVDSERPAKFPRVTTSSACTSVRFDKVVGDVHMEQAMPTLSPLSGAALVIEPDVCGTKGDAAALAMAAAEKEAAKTKPAEEIASEKASANQVANEGSAMQRVRAAMRFDKVVGDVHMDQAMPSFSPLSGAALAIQPDVCGTEGDAAALAMAAAEKADTEIKTAKEIASEKESAHQFANEGSAMQKVRADNATVARVAADKEVDQKRLAEKSAEQVAVAAQATLQRTIMEREAAERELHRVQEAEKSGTAKVVEDNAFARKTVAERMAAEETAAELAVAEREAVECALRANEAAEKAAAEMEAASRAVRDKSARAAALARDAAHAQALAEKAIQDKVLQEQVNALQEAFAKRDTHRAAPAARSSSAAEHVPKHRAAEPQSEWSEKLSWLTQMGFSSQDAEQALSDARGDVPLAVSIRLSLQKS